MIAKATPTVTVLPVTATFNGQAHGTTGTVAGVNGADLGAATISYNTADGQAPVNAGSYVATGSFAENDNYTEASTTATIVIAKATPTVTVLPVTATFNGQAHGTTGTVAGVGGADLGAATISYNTTNGQAPVNAGSYVATGKFAGNDNYTAASGDATIIVNKASSTTLVTFEAGPYTYRRSAFTATAAVTGAGGLNQVVPVVYSGDCVNVSVAGCTATATFAGDANHDGDADTKSIQILKKALTITANDATKILGATLTFAGTEFTVDGLVSGDTIATVTLTSSGTAPGAAAGAYPIVASTAMGAAVGNYDIRYVDGELKVLYRWDGFLQPINDTAHDLGPMSKFKAGQTIPAKFVLKNAAGAVVQQTGIPTFTRTDRLGACDSAAALENPELVSASVVPQYKWDGSQYHYNWSTKGLPAGLYRIYANLADGTAQSVDICLTK